MMYQPQHNSAGELAHSSECKMAFGRKDKSCPRCVEMMNGAPARGGWQKGYYENKAREYAQFRAHLASHDCVKSRCGHVCTAFES